MLTLTLMMQKQWWVKLLATQQNETVTPIVVVVIAFLPAVHLRFLKVPFSMKNIFSEAAQIINFINSTLEYTSFYYFV